MVQLSRCMLVRGDENVRALWSMSRSRSLITGCYMVVPLALVSNVIAGDRKQIWPSLITGRMLFRRLNTSAQTYRGRRP